MRQTTFFITWRIINVAIMTAAVMLLCDSARAQSRNERTNSEYTIRDQRSQIQPFELPPRPESSPDRNRRSDNRNLGRSPYSRGPLTNQSAASPDQDDDALFGENFDNNYGQQDSDLEDMSLMAEEREARVRSRRIDSQLLAEERADQVRLQELSKVQNSLPGIGDYDQHPQRGNSRNAGLNAQDSDQDSTYEDHLLSDLEDLQAGRTLDDTQGPLNQPPRHSSSRTSYDDYSASDPYQESDPYKALGMRIGNFLFFPSIEANSFYSDNVFHSNDNKKGDVALELQPNFVLESQWSRHQLVGELRGTQSYYSKYSSENEEDVLASIRGRIDLTSRTNLEGDANYSITTENRSSIDAPANASELSNIETRRIGGGVNHRFNRLSIGLRGSVGETHYDDVTLNDGTVHNNDDRDYREIVGTLRAGYEFHPGKTAFVEGEISGRTYHNETDDSGFQRGSTGFELRGGLGIDIGPKIRGEFSLGYTHRSPDDNQLSDIDGVVVDADLTWRPNALTTWHLTAASSVDETTQRGISGIFNRSVGVDVRHALRRHFILTAGANYLFEQYEGSNLEENILTLNAGAEYIFNRSAALIAEYKFTDNDSTDNDDDYQVNEVRVGVRLRR